MKIPYHYSLEVAHRVVDKINLSKNVAKNVCIQSWANGREQGLCIQVENSGEWLKICVAQQRSSDSILIVVGQDGEFDSHNMPSEAVWANRVTFNPDKQKEAANYIKKQIMECWKDN